MIANLNKQFSAPQVNQVLQSGVVRPAYIGKYQKLFVSSDFLIFLNIWFARVISVKYSRYFELNESELQSLRARAQKKYVQILTCNSQRGKEMFGVGVFVYGYIIGLRLFQRYPQLRDEMDHYSCMEIYLILFKELNGQFCSMSYLKLSVKNIFTQKSMNYLIENKSKRNIQKASAETFFGQKIQKINYTFKDPDIALLVQSIPFARKKHPTKHREDQDLLSKKVQKSGQVSIKKQFYDREMHSPLIDKVLRKNKSVLTKANVQKIRWISQQNQKQERQKQTTSNEKSIQNLPKIQKFLQVIKQLKEQNQQLQAIRVICNRSSLHKSTRKLRFVSKSFDQDNFLSAFRSIKSLVFATQQVKQVPVQFGMDFTGLQGELKMHPQSYDHPSIDRVESVKQAKKGSSVQYRKQLFEVIKRSDFNKEKMRSFYFRSKS